MGHEPRRLTDRADPFGRPVHWAVPERFNMARACCDAWAAVEPGRRALIDLGDGGRVWSHGDLRDASTRLAQAFAAQGLGRGDRIALSLPQGAAVIVAHLACQRLGAIALPLFTLFGEEALTFRLSDSGAAAAVTDAAHLDRLAAVARDCPDLRTIWTTGPAAAPVRSVWDDIAAASGGVLCADTAADDPVMMIYTSGTTGPPKGALHAHRFLIGHLPNIEVSHEALPQPGDIGWTPADWAWIGGLMDMAMPCLHYGIPLVAGRMRKFDPDAAFRLIAQTGANRLFLPPTALKLMRQARVPKGVAVRSVTSGGESLAPDLAEWGQAALGATVNEIYGQTECNLVVASSRGHGVVRDGAMGRAAPGHEVAILDETGQRVGPGEIGEICIRRPDPVMFLGYWNRPQQTAAKFRGDWLRSGDLGRMDDDGFVTFIARDDDIITSAGYRIGPTEIENCLTGHPDVAMAAVVGLPDPLRTEAVTAFVVPRAGVTPSETLAEALIARVRRRVSPHAAPRRVIWRHDLPMTATGKIRRRSLRDTPD